MSKWKAQFRQHSVALISLAVALSSLGYNTWRNEQTEANRNVRTAGIELLLTLGELEEVVLIRHWDDDEVRGNPRQGWAHVLTIVDLAELTLEPAIATSIELRDIWAENWSGLGEQSAAEQAITAAIDQMRADMLHVLAGLD